MKIKGWKKFQHYQSGERTPTWIKLHRSILDDMEWHDLDPSAAKTLVMLWLIASEADGMLPDIKKLAFRLRMTEQRVIDAVGKLSHWMEQDDRALLADGYQNDRLEEERESEEEKEQDASAISFARDFENWWASYPRKAAKGTARKAYIAARRRGIGAEELLAGAKRYAADPKRDDKFTKHAATWLNGECWLDEQPSERPALVADADAVLRDKASLVAKGIHSSRTTITQADFEAMIARQLVTEDQCIARGYRPAEPKTPLRNQSVPIPKAGSQFSSEALTALPNARKDVA